jgi:hypothetical protein
MGRTGFSWLGKGPVAGFFEHSDEPLDSVKKAGVTPPLPQYVFTAWCLIKQDKSSWHCA